jgi:2-C-methyl-D-erythritol 4-phosphate cytidylyltransferase
VTSRYFGLIVAAGTGSRLGGSAPKQYQPLAGRTMLHHAVRGLLGAREIETVFVVLAPGDELFHRHDWSGFGDRVAPLYCGGSSRRDSVLNGLVAASSAVDPEDWMLVHDAARPCLAQEDLRRLIDVVSGEETGGILAVPVADTLKRADADQRIVATETRAGLWQAQTPQMFRHGVLLRALEQAAEMTAEVTDEASAVESMGLRPRLVEGRTTNLKVTYAADLELAELILRSREPER